MANDDKFADLIDRIRTATINLMTLDIVTIVGPVDLSIDDLSKLDGNAMRSRINLLDGDILTQVDPKFLDGPFQELRAFHQQRENQGTEIIQRNLELLERLADFAQEVLRGDQADRSDSANT